MAEQLEIRGTQFNKEEINRILGVLRETDPRSRDYVQVLDSFERFLYFGNVIAAAQDLIYGMQDPPPYGVGIKEPEPDNIIPFSPPVEEEDKFETVEPEEDDEVEEEPAHYFDPAVVKSRLTRARAEGKIDKIRPWMEENFGASGFSEIQASQYPKVMSLLDELGVS